MNIPKSIPGQGGAGGAEWFAAIDGAPQGPMSMESLREKAAAGRVTGQTLVWRKGMKAWIAAEQVPGVMEGTRPVSLWKPMGRAALDDALARERSLGLGPPAPGVGTGEGAGAKSPEGAVSPSGGPVPPIAATAMSRAVMVRLLVLVGVGGLGLGLFAMVLATQRSAPVGVVPSVPAPAAPPLGASPPASRPSVPVESAAPSDKTPEAAASSEPGRALSHEPAPGGKERKPAKKGEDSRAASREAPPAKPTKPPNPVAAAKPEPRSPPASAQPRPQAPPKTTVDEQFDRIVGGGSAQAVSEGRTPRGGEASAAPEKPKSVYVPPPVKSSLPERLSQSEIMNVVVQHKSAVRGCIDTQKSKDANLSGTLVMRWTIRPDGSTSGVQVKSGEQGGLGACLSGLVRGWRFSGYSGAPMPPIEFPFKF